MRRDREFLREFAFTSHDYASMHQPFVEMSVGIGEAAQAAVAAGDDRLLDLIGLFYW